MTAPVETDDTEPPGTLTPLVWAAGGILGAVAIIAYVPWLTPLAVLAGLAHLATRLPEGSSQ